MIELSDEAREELFVESWKTGDWFTASGLQQAPESPSPFPVKHQADFVDRPPVTVARGRWPRKR